MCCIVDCSCVATSICHFSKLFLSACLTSQGLHVFTSAAFCKQLMFIQQSWYLKTAFFCCGLVITHHGATLSQQVVDSPVVLQFYEDSCLAQQKFVMADDQTVQVHIPDCPSTACQSRANRLLHDKVVDKGMLVTILFSFSFFWA